MQLRTIKSHARCYSSGFNTHSLNEIVVCFDDGGADSDYINNYEVYLETGPRAGQWVSLSDAFKQRDVITDNYNTRFFEPPTEADRTRGYTE